MSKLIAIRKQIAALEAEAERIAKQEMSEAIAKVKEIMSTFGLTIEHLQSAVAAKTRKVAKKVKAKRTGVGVAKYADPKTGATWSGFGRAPGWIAGAKNRDVFLVDKSGVKAAEAAAKAPVAKKKPAAKKLAAKKVSKPAAKRAVAVAKKTAPAVPGTAAGKKRPSAKKAGRKAVANTVAKKRAASSGGADASAGAEAGTPSAT